MTDRAIAELALFTDDVETVKRFYARLLAITPDAQWPGGAVFAAGDAKILVHERAGGMDDSPPNEDHFALGMADLDAACTELRA